MEAEFLARISQRQPVFLAQTAVLERMCGPLCEAVLDRPEATTTLADLARSNLLLVPLDQRGQWYRYHHLFRDMLLAQLEHQTPRADPGPAAPCGRLAPAERLARGSPGVLLRSRGRGRGCSPGAEALCAGRPAEPYRIPPAVVPVAG
jgi:hypothetical protein